MYVKAGRLKYVYNFLGLALYEVETPSVLSAGKHEIKMEFKYDGGGLGKGGAVSLLVDGQKVAEGRLEHTVPMIFSVDSTCMVGDKLGAPISGDFKEGGNKFNGKINWVRIDLGSENFGSQPSACISQPLFLQVSCLIVRAVSVSFLILGYDSDFGSQNLEAFLLDCGRNFFLQLFAWS